MYQLEVKRYLIEFMFNPSDDWKVIVDIDAMERAKGSQQKDGKKQRVLDAEKRLNELGVVIGVHPKYGRADVVASHPQKGTFLIWGRRKIFETKRTSYLFSSWANSSFNE